MSTPRFTLVTTSSGDWQALYIDGLKQLEGHSLPIPYIFEALNLPLQCVEVPEPDHIEGEVDFTKHLGDVKFCPYDTLPDEDI